MTTIELVANDQLLQVTVNPKISSGEVNTVDIHVDFSDEWNRFGKSAVFFTSYNTNNIYEIVMTNDKCVVPSEVMSKAGVLYIGIRGVNSDNNEVKTTSLVKLKISEGTPTGNATEVEPTPDVYQQLLTAYGKTDNSINKEKYERQAEIAVERARIDNLSTLTNGSTTGDAELLDIRVKADGTTATSAGNAVREQVSELKSDLNDLDDALNTVVITKKPINMLNPSDFISGGYWSNYGKWSEVSDYKYSENFLNFKGHTLRAYKWNGSSYVPSGQNSLFCAIYVNGSVPYPPIAEVSEDGSAVTMPNNENITKIIISVKNSVQLITVDIDTPPTEYTEYTEETTHELNQETFKPFIDMKTGFDSAFAKVIRKSRNVYDANTWTVGKIIDVDGTTDTDVDFLTSPKIEITNGQSLIGYGYRNGSLCELGCLYTILDADNNPLLSVIPNTSPVINIRSMPTAKYIILSAVSFYARMVLLGDIVANTDDDGAVVFETCGDVEEYNTVAKYNKKPLIVANGDSITYGSRTSTELYPNMIQGISYIDYIAHEIGADLLKFAIPGSSCSLWTDGVDHLNALCLRYSEMPDNADLVYIAIGSNDWASQSVAIGQMGDTQNTTFYGALNTLCKGLMEKYPTTPILFATPIKRWEEKNTNPILNPNGEDISLYCDAIKEVCGYYGIPVFDANKETWINPWIESERTKYVPDGIHPNELGHRKMANSGRGFIQKYLIR